MNPSSMDDGSEPDPTGVRDLLRGLPDPGGMPAGLEARIDAALRAEQSQRARSASAQPPNQLECMAPVADLAQHRRRRVHPLLVAAASVVAFAGIGGLVVSQVLGSDYDVTALYGNSAADESAPQVVPNASNDGEFGGSEAAADSAPDEADSAPNAAGSGPFLDASANDGAGTIPYGTETTVTIESETFVEGISEMLPITDFFILSPGAYPTQDDRLNCVTATGEDFSSGEWQLIYTPIDGTDAVIVVRDQGDGVSQAWGISDQCLQGDSTPEVLVERTALNDL